MNCERQDDPTIDGDVKLFRRIHLTQIVEDGDTGNARVSSGAFRDKELSVNIEQLLIAEGYEPDHCLRKHPHHKLVAFKTGAARALGQSVYGDPQADDQSHGIVDGNKNRKKIHDGLREASIWVIPPAAPKYETIQQEKIDLGL